MAGMASRRLGFTAALLGSRGLARLRRLRGLRACRRFRGLALGRLCIRLGGFLVAILAVIRLVEARALEDDRPAAAEEAGELVLLAARALRQRRLGERLQFLELVLATPALVVIGRHE